MSAAYPSGKSSPALVEGDMDPRLVAEAGHEGGCTGSRERENGAASLAAAPAKQRSPCFRPYVCDSRFAALPAPDVDAPV